MTKAQKKVRVVAEVSIYGTSAAGHGYILRLADGRSLGTGDPVNMRSATETLWTALNEAAREGALRPDPFRAVVLVHYDFPQGPMVAEIRCAGAWPYFGDLKWQAGPVYEISADAITKAAQEQQEGRS